MLQELHNGMKDIRKNLGDIDNDLDSQLEAMNKNAMERAQTAQKHLLEQSKQAQEHASERERKFESPANKLDRISMAVNHLEPDAAGVRKYRVEWEVVIKESEELE